jgi:hypothetical protein
MLPARQGRIQGGGRTWRSSPLKLEKNMIFWRKIVIFHTKYPKTFRASLRKHGTLFARNIHSRYILSGVCVLDIVSQNYNHPILKCCTTSRRN